jgi:allophanate hydrolase
VPFAVATDTAGSGRVPAALNGVVGFKPSRGLISTVGLVPACKSLDCISVMAGSIDDVDRVFDVVAARDDNDAWSRDRGPRYGGSPIRVGLPPAGELEFFGDDEMRHAHLGFREHLSRTATVVDVSLAPFLAAGSLLYQGPWVAERLVEFNDFLATQPDSIHPVVRAILRGGLKYTAVDAFAALQRLAELKAVVARVWQSMDVLVVPTIGTTFTVDEVLAAPIDCNTMLGHYTHFGNLLDLVGMAVPLGVTGDGRPYSAMLLGAALTDDTVLHLAAQILDEPREASASDVSTITEERV